MQPAQTKYKPLAANMLRQIEYRFARSRNRPGWWQQAEHARRTGPEVPEASRQPSASLRSGAIGVFLFEVMSARAAIARREVAIDSVPASAIAEVLGISESKLSQLLRGKVAGDDPFPNDMAARLLRLILLGTPDRTEDGGEAGEVAERIVRFFFGRAASLSSGAAASETGQSAARWVGGYFDDQHRHRAVCVRSTEAIGEIYALAYACDPALGDPALDEPPGRARIVRVSGHRRFIQVWDDQGSRLTESGIATLAALRAGVDVYFIFPPGTPAEASAKYFREAAADSLGDGSAALDGLHLLTLRHDDSIGDRSGFHAGDFYVRLLRFVFHECQPRKSLDQPAWRTLIISREPRSGLCAWEPSEAEVDEFAEWLGTYLRSLGRA